METARVCALRGHKVTLLEKSDKLGGNIIPGSVPDFKKGRPRTFKMVRLSA
jgi:2-enoate reductase